MLVEADLPFKVTGLGVDPFGPYGVVAVLMAVEALVDGADPREADALLREVDGTGPARPWAAGTPPRRRACAAGCAGVDCADVGRHARPARAAGLSPAESGWPLSAA